MALRTLPRRLIGRVFHLSWPRWKHEENSLRGAIYAHRHGYHAIDLDLQMTADGIIVVTHWSRPMRKDKFYDREHRLGRYRTVASMDWWQVRRLRTPDGYSIRRVEALLRKCARLGIVALLEPKSDPRFRLDWPWLHIAQVAEDVGCTVSVRALPENAAALPAARRAGIQAWEI
jgi:glycerophosphoryl diester phosphodiesterase